MRSNWIFSKVYYDEVYKEREMDNSKKACEKKIK